MSTAQSRYLKFGIADGDSSLRVWNDLPGTAAGATNGEAGKGRSIEYGCQIGDNTTVWDGTVPAGRGVYGEVATTISANYGGGAGELVMCIVNGVSYTLVPGTAVTVPRIVQAILTAAGIPYA